MRSIAATLPTTPCAAGHVVSTTRPRATRAPTRASGRALLPDRSIDAPAIAGTCAPASLSPRDGGLRFTRLPRR